ncbi:hypothetical protein ACFVYE_32390 [Streptomyces sp. NPDC058239]|uniref:hypothetical protein n=1 Tax=Streptomyces sp. NPDC058239 TaxID=3346395 RepID=UPI0036EBF518
MTEEHVPYQPSSKTLARLELARTEWPTVQTFLGCECTDADPVACTGSPEQSGTPQCGPAPAHRQCSCHHIRTEDEHASIRAAVAAKAFDSEQVLRDYASILTASSDPDADAWAAALVWAASRIHGGHQSIYANRDFTKRFGVNPYPGEPQ